MQTYRFRITGRVQGVSYRAWTKEMAQTLGIAGHVRNLSDGSVEAVASLDQGLLDTFIAHLRQGPPAASVESVTYDPVTDTGAEGFHILR